MTAPQVSPATAALAAAPQARPKNAEEAAKQFEAILIAQMMRTAREAASEDEDSTSSTMIEVGEQQFSQVLANNGGLGLAKLVMKGLNHANR